MIAASRVPIASGDRGVGAVGTTAAFLVFMLLLLAAVQVLFNLYATSMVTAAAHDAAREVAGFRPDHHRCAAVAEAETRFVDRLGSYGEEGHATLAWRCDRPDVVSLRVIAQHPSLLPPRLFGLWTLGELDRTIEVRIEAAR